MSDIPEKASENNSNELKKSIFVHEKIVYFLNSQQVSVDYLNNKLNWIIVADVALIGFLVSKNKHIFGLQQDAFLLVVISLLIALCSIWSRKYSHGPKLKELMEKSLKWSHMDLITNFNKKLEEDISNNEKAISELALWFKFSIVFLVAGIILLFLSV